MDRIQTFLVQQKAAGSSPRYLLENQNKNLKMIVINLGVNDPLGTRALGCIKAMVARALASSPLLLHVLSRC